MEGALRLVRDADFATANHEGTFFDLRTKRIPPRESSVLMAGPPELAADIKNLGVRFVSKANNHSVDWGGAGLLEELRLLDAASLPYAGAGDSRASARAAGFVDLPKGRIGVVSAASSFSVGSIPLDEDADIPARPGISVLRTTSVQIVNAKEMAALQQMNAVAQLLACRSVATAVVAAAGVAHRTPSPVCRRRSPCWDRPTDWARSPDARGR